MKELRPIRLKQLKVEARLLHKKLKLNLDDSVERYLRHPLFDKKTHSQFKAQIGKMRLKHAYHIIAFEYGYDRWEDLKQYVINQDLLYRSSGVGFVHKWFKSYIEACRYQAKNGGYLLRFWADYIVCGIEYIQLLQLHSYSKDWELIGFDWVKPHDQSAYQRLYQKALLQYYSL